VNLRAGLLTTPFTGHGVEGERPILVRAKYVVVLPVLVVKTAARTPVWFS